MKSAQAQLEELRALIMQSAGEAGRVTWLRQVDEVAAALEAQAAQIQRLRQDIEEAERARDVASLARMRVLGQLNTVHKTLTAATPEFDGDSEGDLQHQALRRIEWLATHGGHDPAAVLAAKEAEMNAPMPGHAVLEAVLAGERPFTKAQLEFSVSEAMVLCGWEFTPLEIIEKGEPWLAQLLLTSHQAVESPEN